ncbi:trimeric intracellular cation channel type b [Lasius niger]|uniref:Trimeric intracellular cation channel type b n=1 Tax=Lasius niger TaxID=67767 RepID=A0A0J7KM06_LASNI|nr:trimeric intracellular cation channel type b [Lasius niger]
MDPEAFLDMANQVIKLKMFPYFDIAHSVLCALHVREDLGPGAQAFSRKHPLSCWLSTMLVVFASGMLCNGLLGEPILAPLKNTPQVIVATVVWCKKVYDGVTHAGKLYPNAYLIMILIGTLKGCPTKASMVASIIFVLDKKTDLISAPHALVYFGIVIFFVYFKLSSILLGIHDPFVPFENLFCALFLGGIWDSLAKLLGRGQAKDEKADAKKTN